MDFGPLCMAPCTHWCSTPLCSDGFLWRESCFGLPYRSQTWNLKNWRVRGISPVQKPPTEFLWSLEGNVHHQKGVNQSMYHVELTPYCRSAAFSGFQNDFSQQSSECDTQTVRPSEFGMNLGSFFLPAEARQLCTVHEPTPGDTRHKTTQWLKSPSRSVEQRNMATGSQYKDLSPRCSSNGLSPWLVVWTPMKNMNVNWDDYSQYMGK